jgi:hypothetical protein
MFLVSDIGRYEARLTLSREWTCWMDVTGNAGH